jgi:prepilin-type N-terminal cleavage/methylation domain-containing protein
MTHTFANSEKPLILILLVINRKAKMHRSTIKETGFLLFVSKFICLSRKRNPVSQEKGLTLVECLAAIVIFGLSITAITSPIMLAMATRVRAYRAQQAMQIAQGEIDRVRLILERGDLPLAQLTPLLPPNAGDGEPKAVEAPTGEDTACNTTTASNPNQWCRVTLKNEEFAVQTFRTKTKTPKDISPESKSQTPIGLMMGVRVYPIAAINSNQTLSKEPMSLGFSAITTSSAAPLVAIYTPIVRSDLDKSADIYKELLK